MTAEAPPVPPTTRHPELLILAIDEQTASVGTQLIGRLTDSERPATVVVATPGAALREVHRRRPRAVAVLVGGDVRNDVARLDATAALIVQLRRRRPELPVLALASVREAGHDDDHEADGRVERAVRAAGPSSYLPIRDPADERALLATLAAVGVSIGPSSHSGPSPPQSRPRTRPPPRRAQARGGGASPTGFG